MEKQQLALVISEEKKRFCFFYDTGTGKTLIGLSIYRQKQIKTLIICPFNLIENAWQDDANKFGLEEVTGLWASTKAKRTKLIKGDWNIGAINFESFKSNYNDLVDAGIEMVFVDESSKIKRYDSGITKKVDSFSQLVEYFYEFSGSPAPNTRMEYYSQIKCVNRTAFPS